MPKLKFSSQYGALNIFPFFFGWISLLAMPPLVCIKDRTVLERINKILCYIVYFPISVILLTIFMLVNAALLPLAYCKTVYHKLLLLFHYKSKGHCKNLAIFICLGLPILIIAQIFDAVRFMRHSYSSNQKQ